jgi:hypothetical protein
MKVAMGRTYRSWSRAAIKNQHRKLLTRSNRWSWISRWWHSRHPKKYSHSEALRSRICYTMCCPWIIFLGNKGCRPQCMGHG